MECLHRRTRRGPGLTALRYERRWHGALRVKIWAYSNHGQNPADQDSTSNEAPPQTHYEASSLPPPREETHQARHQATHSPGKTFAPKKTHCDERRCWVGARNFRSGAAPRESGRPSAAEPGGSPAEADHRRGKHIKCPWHERGVWRRNPRARITQYDRL